MAFKKHAGKTKIMYFPKTASTAIAEGALVALSSGKLIPATSSTAKHVGVCRKTIAATDSDYASTTLTPVEVPVENWVVWEAPVTSGLVAADIVLYQDLTDSVTVNRAASTYDAVMCVAVLSTTLGHFILTDRADAKSN